MNEGLHHYCWDEALFGIASNVSTSIFPFSAFLILKGKQEMFPKFL
jgi:hypothetical protein